jgi:predicted lipid-binding transport protein (Tim44 family)
MRMWSWILVAMLAFASFESEAARRLGGGGSMGRQSGNVTQREAAKPPAQAPAQNQATPAQQPGANPAAAAPRRPWGAMLGGLAAGLGLAWLASSLGLGQGFANFLLIALLVMAALALFGYIKRSRSANANAGRSPYAYQGAGATADAPATPRQYSPNNVGNDASARPWERNSMAFEAKGGQGSGVQIGSGLAGSQTWGIPPGFDTAGFLEAAKRNYVSLQDAWDRGDTDTLRAMMTDEMLGEIKSQLATRERTEGGQQSKTDVVMLEASLLGIEDTGSEYMASVEFSGMIREEPSAGPTSFREVWNMTKPKTGGGWLVAGVQALQ